MVPVRIHTDHNYSKNLIFIINKRSCLKMRKRNLRKVIAGVLALTMVALSMGFVTAGESDVISIVSAAVTTEYEQDELSEFKDEIMSDLEFLEDGLSGSYEEIGKIISSGKTAVEKAETFDELEAVWESIRNEIDAVSLD